MTRMLSSMGRIILLATIWRWCVFSMKNSTRQVRGTFHSRSAQMLRKVKRLEGREGENQEGVLQCGGRDLLHCIQDVLLGGDVAQGEVDGVAVWGGGVRVGGLDSTPFAHDFEIFHTELQGLHDLFSGHEGAGCLLSSVDGLGFSPSSPSSSCSREAVSVLSYSSSISFSRSSSRKSGSSVCCQMRMTLVVTGADDEFTGTTHGKGPDLAVVASQDAGFARTCHRPST